jgi:hypothetical protein
MVVEIGVSMLNWFKGKATPPSAGPGMSRAFCADGLVLAHGETDLPANSLDPIRSASDTIQSTNARTLGRRKCTSGATS